MYIDYCAIQPAMDRGLKKLRDTNPSFGSALQELERDPLCQGLSLYSILSIAESVGEKQTGNQIRICPAQEQDLVFLFSLLAEDKVRCTWCREIECRSRIVLCCNLC